MKTWLWIPIALSFFGGTARADQCAWIDESAATNARKILRSSPTFIEHCEPCGDKAPGAPQVAKTVEIRTVGDEYKEVSVNGKPIDLAYVFVKTAGVDYKNLAGLAGCPATGVSASLEIAEETPTGVLITADNEPLPPPRPTTAIAREVAPPAPPPSHVYVYTTTPPEVAWLPLALAAAGGFSTGSAFTMMLLGLRRRRAMQPRATNLHPPDSGSSG